MRLMTTMAAVIIGLTACTVSPVQDAQTLNQKAFASYGTYVVYQGKAADLVKDPVVPENIKQGLRAADKVAYPAAEAMVDAALEVDHIQRVINDCGTPECKATAEQQLTNAITHLSELYFSAQPKVLALATVVKGAK